MKEMGKIIVLGLFLLIGCAKSHVVKPTTADTQTETTKQEEVTLDQIVLAEVFFKFDSAEIGEEYFDALTETAKIIEKMDSKIEIWGNCDARGGHYYNLALGQNRANQVKKYLEDKGIAEERMRWGSNGKSRLRVPNAKTELDHQQNRRVEMRLVK